MSKPNPFIEKAKRQAEKPNPFLKKAKGKPKDEMAALREAKARKAAERAAALPDEIRQEIARLELAVENAVRDYEASFERACELFRKIDKLKDPHTEKYQQLHKQWLSAEQTSMNYQNLVLSTTATLRMASTRYEQIAA